MQASGSSDDGGGQLPATAHTPRPPDAILLFLHGLESGPGGSKAQHLRKAFPNNSVLVPDMEMSAFSLTKRNSFLRTFGSARWSMDGCMQLALDALKDELGQLLGGDSEGGERNAALTGPQESSAGGGAEEPQQQPAEGARRPDGLVQERFSREEQELIRSRLVVVGSSWGGAVGCALLEAGLRPCRAVLLAPALSIFGFKRVFWPDFTPRGFLEEQTSISRDRATEPKPRCTELLVLHGDGDETVPVEGSRELAREFGARLPAGAASAEDGGPGGGGNSTGARPEADCFIFTCPRRAESSDARESVAANGSWFRYEEIAGGDHRLNAALIDTGRLAQVIAE